MSKVVNSDKTAESGARRLMRTVACLGALLYCSAWSAVAQSVTLAWNRNSETNLSSYHLKYGETSGSYTGQVSVATNVTTATVNNLVQGRTYYFVVTARNTGGVESDPSSVVSHYLPRPGTNAVPVANAATVAATEDTPRTLTLTGSDGDGDPLTYVVGTPPANGALSGTAPALTYTPNANFSGADSFTFRVNDGLTNSPLATVSLTVSSVNDAPTLSAISNRTLQTNPGPQTVSLAGIGSGAPNESQTLAVTATSSNPSIVPNPAVNYTSPNATGSLSFTPVSGAIGIVTISVTVNDGQAQNNTFTRTFTVSVGTPPEVTLFAEAEAGTIVSPMVSGSDANASGGQYVYSPTANSGTVTLSVNIPQPDDYRVWCRVRSPDDSTDSFSVSVDGGPQDIYDTAEGTWAAGWQWTLLNGRTTGNPRVLTLAQGSHTLTFQGREVMTGLDAIYVTTDPGFTPGGTTPNSAPTLNAISNLTLSEDAAQSTVNLAGITDGSTSENQTLTISASSSNPSLIPTPTVNYTSPNATGTLSLTPAANASGTATITVNVNDGQAVNNTFTRTFTVTVNAVNDVPTLSALSNVSLAEDAGPQTVNLSGIGSGAPNETQTLNVSASSSNTGLIPAPTVAYTSPNATGTLSFTPAVNASGTATITVTVNDGQAANNTVSRTFTVTVSGANDAPTLSAINNLTLNEDASAQSVNLSGITAGTGESQALSVTASSSNTGLIPAPTVNYTSPNATGTLSLAPAANASGTATITVTVNDGQAVNNTFSRTFNVTVNAVNDVPTLNALSNVSLAEDAGPQTVNLSGIGSGAPNETQTLNVSASSSNTGLIPTPTVAYTSPNATGTLTFAPAVNASGTATITVTVNDGQAANNTVTRTFTVTVSGANDAPTLNAINNLTLNEDASAQSVSLSGITAGTGESQPLSVTASSSNTGLIPTPTVNYTSPNATGTLSLTPAANASGTATITVTVNDGQSANNTFTRTFNVTVNAVNDVPTLTALSNVSLTEDAGGQTVNLSGIGSGAANENQTLTVSASSSNTGLIPTPTVAYTSPNATGTLSFTPALNGSGTATLTVTVNDGQAQNNTITRTFTVTVSGGNDAPTLNALSDLTLNEDAGAQTVSLSGISPGAANETQTLTVTASSSATSIIQTPTVSYTSPNATGTLTLRTVTNASGTATITVTVNDGQAQNNTVTRTFNVTVSGLNDTPTISDIGNQTINESTATAAVPFTVGDVETPAANLTVSGTSSNPSLVPNNNIVFGGSGASRTVTVTPAATLFGSATITIQVSDGNGAVASDSFMLTVNGVNQTPTLDPISNVTVNEDSGPQTVNLTGIGSGAANESQTLLVTATSSNPSLVPAPAVSYTSPNPAGTLAFTPAANANGSATVTVTVNDGQSQNNTVSRSFTITVTSLNDPPSISSIADQTIAQNTATGLIPFTVNDPETAAGTLTLSANSSNPTLLPNSGISLGGTGSSRTIRLTPAANQFGSTIVTVTVADDNGGLSSDSFVLTVNTVNLPPTLDALVDLTLVEDTGVQTLALTGISSGSASETQPLTVTAVSSDPTLVPHPAVAYSSPASSGSLSIAPVANANGLAVITVTVTDGQSQNGLTTRSFVLTLKSINDAPTLNPLANVALDQNTAQHTVPLAGISSGAANENQDLTVTAVSSNPSLIPNPTISYFSPNSTGTLNLHPAANASGTATITVTVDDGQSTDNTVVRVFTVTVSGANIPPTITDLPDISIPANSVASPLDFVIGDAETPAQNLVVVATSSNPNLVWTNNITISGTDSNRVASVRTTVGQAGFTVITFTVYDGDGASASDSFVLTAVPANVTPTLDPLPSIILSEDAGPQTINLTGITPGSPTETQTLIVSAVSSTPGVIPHPIVNYTSPNTSGTLTLQPVSNVTGSATIIVTVNDGQSQNNLMTRTFGVLVNPFNDTPTISAIPNQLVDQDVATPVIPFVIADQETPATSLGVSAASSDTTLVPTANIALGGSGANRTIQVTPAPLQSGSATITIYVNDGSLTAASSFNITVGEGNTPPAIVAPASLSTDSYTPITNTIVRVSDQESRPDDLVLSAISYNQTVIPGTNILFSGSGSNRTVTFRPVPGKSGSVTVSLGVSDGRAITRTLCTIDVALGTAPKSKLNVRKRGRGNVEPALDGQELTVGASYTLKAIPASGELFIGWSGGVTSKSSTVTFVMKTNFSLECAFTNSPFPGMKGSYNGLFYEVAGPRPASSGILVLTPTERGTYTGRLKLGTALHPISGSVDISCKATNVISRRGAGPLRVELDFSHTNQVVGRVSDGTWESPLLGDRASFNSRTNPAPYAGTYTLVLPGQDDPDLGPEGDGYATLKIDGNGLATVAGSLADGTRLTHRVPVAIGGQWPLYLPLYGGSGVALSWMTVSNRATDDVSGLLSWTKISAPKSKLYAGGFTNECMAIGSLFAAPPRGSSRVLELNQADLTFAGGNLQSTFTNALAFDALGRISNLSPNKLLLRINPVSGLISGTVTDPALGKPLRFSGAVFQKQNGGSGFLLGTNRSARFVLSQ